MDEIRNAILSARAEQVGLIQKSVVNAEEVLNDDAYFWQNLFSINMIEIDFPYFHFDFGSSTVWPKRFDLGYIFPLFNYVLYQNNLGDYDNTALFGDIKVRKPGIGSLWASIFIDEINGLNNDVRISPRAMFAGQLGGKIVIASPEKLT